MYGTFLDTVGKKLSCFVFSISIQSWLVVLAILKNMKVNGKDYPI